MTVEQQLRVALAITAKQREEWADKYVSAIVDFNIAQAEIAELKVELAKLKGEPALSVVGD